jgi:hypothetical protein
VMSALRFLLSPLTRRGARSRSQAACCTSTSTAGWTRRACLRRCRGAWRQRAPSRPGGCLPRQHRRARALRRCARRTTRCIAPAWRGSACCAAEAARSWSRLPPCYTRSSRRRTP